MAEENNRQNKIPFTDEQRDFLMDYLFNKFMEDMMNDEMRRNDPYNQPPPKDPQGNIIIEASMPGNMNKKETNMLMDMIGKGVEDIKKEGIMTAANERIIQLDSLVDPDMDPGDLRTIYDEMMKESGGNYPGVSFDDFLKNIGTRTAKRGTLPGNLNKAEIEALMAVGKTSEPRKASDGGIMFLEPGGEVKKGSVRIPSTYGNKSFEDFLKDLGFTKVDENTGKVRGSKGEWNKFLKSKGIKVGSPAATNLLNTMLKDAGKMPYISVDMSQKGLGQALVDEITDTEAGKPNVKDIRSSAINKIEEIRVDANEKFGRNPTKKKYAYIKDQVVKFFPKVAGTTALLNFIAGRALGAVGALMPTEMGDATLYDSEGNLKEGMGLEEANEGILQAVKENQPTEEQGD